jgi:CRISPR/Cas system CSM-associated protein Csm5 (group 7 of RAMP superfamily)
LQGSEFNSTSSDIFVGHVEDKASSSNISFSDNLTTASGIFNDKLNSISLNLGVDDTEDKETILNISKPFQKNIAIITIPKIPLFH